MRLQGSFILIECIDHCVMLAQLRHVSPDVFDVVQDYLCVPDPRGSGKGMVAGGAISPLLGGLYLTPLDRAMEGLCQKNWIRYQRFMDDYVIFGKTEKGVRLSGLSVQTAEATGTWCAKPHPTT